MNCGMSSMDLQPMVIEAVLGTFFITQSSLPWLVAEDFNEILRNSEKIGGHLQGAAPMARFRSSLVDCNLVDMGYVGSKFT